MIASLRAVDRLRMPILPVARWKVTDRMMWLTTERADEAPAGTPTA